MWRRVLPVRCVPAPRQLAADFSRLQSARARPRLDRGCVWSHPKGYTPCVMHALPGVIGGGKNKKAHRSGRMLTKISKETKENRPEAVIDYSDVLVVIVKRRVLIAPASWARRCPLNGFRNLILIGACRDLNIHSAVAVWISSVGTFNFDGWHMAPQLNLQNCKFQL